MSKQTLIDLAWQSRIQHLRPAVPPPARVPPLLPEPSAARPAVAVPLTVVAGTAIAAFVGFWLGASLGQGWRRVPVFHDDIDWESASLAADCGDFATQRESSRL